MDARIIDRGRGPEIEGTRITVYDVLDYHDWPVSRVAGHFGLSLEQIEAANRYIEDHRDDVMAAYQRGLDRCAIGNEPEVEAVANEGHRDIKKLRAVLGRDPARFRELMALRRDSPERFREILASLPEPWAEEESVAGHCG
jgi:uncharacterized protein (DUF433 family)